MNSTKRRDMKEAIGISRLPSFHLARVIYDERRFDRKPILANALLDAGCDSKAILNRYRSDGLHVRVRATSHSLQPNRLGNDERGRRRQPANEDRLPRTAKGFGRGETALDVAEDH